MKINVLTIIKLVVIAALYYGYAQLSHRFLENISIWADGYILIAAYAISNIYLVFLLKDHSIKRRILFTFILYSISYALMALPYFIVSFLQPLERSTLIHSVLLIVFIEIVYQKFLE